MNQRKNMKAQLEKTRRYKAGTPWYCTWLYWVIFLGATTLDTITLYQLYDAVLNGNAMMAIITTIAVTVVLDIYSCWLPSLLRYMSEKKKYICFGGMLAGIIALIGGLSVAFRLSTGDVSTSLMIVQLSSWSQSFLNLVLGLVPIASTIALLYLSIQKEVWDNANKIYRLEQLLISLETAERELQLSLGETIRLQEIDHENYRGTLELIKAFAIKAKSDVRCRLVITNGDKEAVAELARPILPDTLLHSLTPGPLEETKSINIKYKNYKEEKFNENN